MERWWNGTDRGREVQGEKHYLAWEVGEKMGKERWWNGTDRGRGNRQRATVSTTILALTSLGSKTRLRS